MLPSDWLTTWKHPIISAQTAEPRLDNASSDFLMRFGLPHVLIFEFETEPCFEISFERLGRVLETYSDITQLRFDDPRRSEWSQYLIIGDEEFCNGTACHCICVEDGTIHRLDCELERPECFVNTTLHQYAESLLAVRDWSENHRSRKTVQDRESWAQLDRRLREIDEVAFQTNGNFWASLIELAAEQTELRLEVTNDPAHSKPRF